MFKEKGYEVVKNVLGEQLLEHLKTQFDMVRCNMYILNNIPQTEQTKFCFNDRQVINSFANSAYVSETLLITLQPLVEKIVGLSLYPTYSYYRHYYNGAEMLKHTDRPSCEYSVTLCIADDKNCKWPIYFVDKNKNEDEIVMNPGDVVVYSGVELVHWRLPFQGNEHLQCFLHYVNASGPHSYLKYDRRQNLGLPAVINKTRVL